MATTSEETIALLHSVPLFATLSDEDLAEVAAVTVPRHFDAGEVVFREGDAQHHVLRRPLGRVRAVREHGGRRTLTLATFGPGEIFGELAMFEDESRSATIEAVDDTDACAILGQDMRYQLRSHPDIRSSVAARRSGPVACARPTNAWRASRSRPSQSRVAAALAGETGGGRSAPIGGLRETDRAHHRHPDRPGAARRVLA